MSLLGDWVGWAVGAWIGDAVIAGSRSRSARGRVFLGGLRVVSGRQPGLTEEWCVAEWTVRTGRLGSEMLVVPIVATVKGSRRPAELGELVGANDTIIITVRTESAVLEWSMLRRFDGLALRALGVPESDAL